MRTQWQSDTARSDEEQPLASALSRAATAGSEPVSMPLAALRPADSPRAGELDPQHVRRLMTVRDLPPVLIHRATLRVIDGMHRLAAARLAGRTEVTVQFFDGSDDEAFVHAVRSNIHHGLRLSTAERSAAAQRIMESQPALSDRAVAATVGLSVKTVAAVRRRASGEIPQLDARVGLDGRVRPLDAARGRREAAAYIEAHPHASLRLIAAQTGISVGTARDVRDRLRRGEDPVGRRPGRCAGGGPPAEPGAVAPAAVAPPVAAAPRTGPADAERPRERPEDRRHGLTSVPTAQPPRRGGLDPLAALAKDPSVRFSEPGRMLLRLLDNRVLAGPEAQRLLAAVPEHSRAALTAAVHQHVNTWLAFADVLAKAA
ncbi:ParB/RepB/Spo0J family partition protein [Kitasatospora sp. NBC_01266]|uniref:ParB/RepB/Spo0J family partition protein n=1 Tax=Kitasatospora sp. NBC_01266 TaxID=2903572 RepID=UPI002E31CA70|nr:ParB/RepB/Spo0J family partition protein [Kitasatospora sp. NBC_01266]